MKFCVLMTIQCSHCICDVTAEFCFTEYGKLPEDGRENATAFTSDTYYV